MVYLGGKALDAVGVLVDFDLRRPESVYYNPEIHELPGLDSSHPKQATQASEQSLADRSEERRVGKECSS